jgi:hypothetical protein
VPDPKKIESIKKWQSSGSIKGKRSFLGLVNFYRKLIKDFLALAKPFTDFLKKEGSFEWRANRRHPSS